MRSEFPFKDLYFDYLKAVRNYSSHTQTAYSNDLGQFFEFASDSLLDNNPENINSSLVRRWVRFLASDEIEAKSIHRKVSALKSYLKFLHKQKHIDKAVSVEVQLPKVKKSIPSYVKVPEMDKLINSMKNQASDFESFQNAAILATFYHTGMRRAELISLATSDVDLSKMELKVLGKGNKERIIPFTIELSEFFKELQVIKSNESIQSNLVFCTKKGEAIGARWLYGMINEALGATYSDKKSPHVLRHSFATHLLQNGADINAIKELLGHSSLTATQLYAHNDIKQLKKVYDQSHPFS